MITLSYNTTALDLPADLLWSDEFTWQPIEQSVDWTITGAVVVQTAERLAGRPITLQGGERFAWIDRATLDQLLAWAAVPGREMTLNIRGTQRTVIFRHNEPPVIEASMLLYHSEPDAATPYTCTIRLMEV